MITKLRSALLVTAIVPGLAIAGPVAQVTTGNDSGEGSLRAALMSGATSIKIKPSVDVIDLEAPLVYAGTEPLTIKGTGQTIDGFGLGLDPILTISQGADLTISGLTFDAGGGNAFGPYERLVNEGGGNAIYVDVRDNATGVVRVTLRDLTVRGTGNHGIHISDCVLEGGGSDSCGDGNSGEGEGSDASIEVHATDVFIERSGFGTQDADGLRVDERGNGDIRLFVNNSVFSEIGADGIELDEGGPGDVYVDVINTAFILNGEYCLINEFVPGDDCDDDGDPDVDDGFDIDESGPGYLLGSIRNVNVIANYDEGLDFDEAGSGDTDLDFRNITLIDNADEGIKVSEEDEGDNIARLRRIFETGDLEFEESGDGNIFSSIRGSTIEDDYKFVEEDDGIVEIEIKGTTIDDEIEIESDDGDAGTVDAFVRIRGSEFGDIVPVDGTVIQPL